MKTHTVRYTWGGQYSNRIDCTLVFTATFGFTDDACRKAGVTATTMAGVVDNLAAAQRHLAVWHHGDAYAWKTGWAWEGGRLVERLAAAIKALTGVTPVVLSWNLTHRVDSFIVDLRHQERMKANA